MRKSNKLRILILGSKEYPVGSNRGEDKITSGGYERYTQELVEELSKNKDLEIIVVTRKFPGTKEFERKKNIEIHGVKWFKGFFLRNISFNFFSYWKANELEFDIIIANGVFATISGFFLKKLKKCKLISRPGGVASDQPQYDIFLRLILDALEKFAYKNADTIVFLSEGEKEGFHKKLGVVPKKYVIIPTAVNADRFSIKASEKNKLRKSFNFEKTNCIITFVGRLNKVKGTEYLIEAVKMMNDDKLRCLIVGDGPEMENLIKLAGNDKRIVFTGHRIDTPQILSISNIFVLSSLSEGLPISLLEAMAAAKACIVTDIGLPVKHMKNALVVNPKNSSEIKNAIEILISNPKLAKKIGKTARSEVVKKRLWKKVVNEYMKII